MKFIDYVFGGFSAVLNHQSQSVTSLHVRHSPIIAVLAINSYVYYVEIISRLVFCSIVIVVHSKQYVLFVAMENTADTKTLEEYRKINHFSYTALAGLIGILGSNPARTVERWCKGERTPEPANMRKIIKRTNGVVKPESFYGLSQ